MDVHALNNLVAWTSQTIVIAALAALLSWVIKVDAAGIRFAYWRAVLLLCLLLPLLQGRQVGETPPPVPSVNATAVAVQPPNVTAFESGPVLEAIDWTPLVLFVIVGGGAARLVWLGMSLLRLRRLRRMGSAAPASDTDNELQQIIGTRAEIRRVECLGQPVTFGVWRPVILLPERLAAATPEVQRAVLSHELFHVKRRDWAWLLFEECVCAVLWFNPAVWWLASRVELAREAVVDELAVLATGRRRAYVEALLSFADDDSPSPVAAFGKRRQLFNRIVLLSKEAAMSSRRLVLACAVTAAALALGTWQAVRAFPLTEAPQLVVQHHQPGPFERRAAVPTPENPVPRRLDHQTPVYPPEARVARASGTVALVITLDELGRVVEARRTNLTLSVPELGVSLSLKGSGEEQPRFLINRSVEQSDAVRAVAAAVTEAAIDAVGQWRYEPPAKAPLAFPVSISFSPRDEGREGERTSAAPVIVGGVDAAKRGPVRVGGEIRPPKKIKHVAPEYPREARDARAQGLVILEVRIDRDGFVSDARVLKSIPALDQAAVEAVEQWRFMPTLLNGVPVPVIMTVTVNFTLAPGDLNRGAPGAEQPPVVVKEVKPSYTAEALRAGIEGNVEVEATIGTDGKVIEAQVIKGVPMLNESALEAVHQWEFKPLAAPATVTIEMTFRTKRK